MGPGKVNVASLGNMTPHLHWHVIPRFADDAHFPNPVWTEAVRTTEKPVLAARRALLPKLAADIVAEDGKMNPTALTVHQKSRVLDIAFEDGSSFSLPFEFLRVYSPSAEVRGHGARTGSAPAGQARSRHHGGGTGR
jgi:hypothetical protein